MVPDGKAPGRLIHAYSDINRHCGDAWMKVFFRTDASLQIGSGHVMRCLALADALRDHGAHCHFICREHPGHMFAQIRERGHDLSPLPAGFACSRPSDPVPAHAAWLGCDWRTDAKQTRAALRAHQADWLVLDHYALDRHWEEDLKSHYRSLLVIDDLADRPHQCKLLLDQTHRREPGDYGALLPADSRVLAGASFALLRPEFAVMRAYSLQRRRSPSLQRLLVSMGGVDSGNATGQVLAALQKSTLPAQCRVTVVMGAAAPFLDAVREQAAQMSLSTDVVVEPRDMARLMADADLSIGAAGGTAWERCCLGLPTIMIVLASNQRKIAETLRVQGAVVVVDSIQNQLRAELRRLATEPELLARMSLSASRVTDGHGANAVVAEMEACRD